MSNLLLSNTIDDQCNQVSSKITCTNKLFRGFLEGHCDEFFKELVLPESIHNELGVWALIEKWQEMLSLLLILHEREELQQHATKFVQRMHYLNACYIWQEMQLVSAYKIICAHLLNQPTQKLEIHQYSGGSAPLEWGERWSWGSVPQCQFHAELGFLWCLYGYLTKENHYFKAAESLAEWQLNTLDHKDLPLVGLFSQEENTSESKLLINNYLLFSAVSIFAERGDMGSIAQKLLDRMTNLSSNSAIDFSPLQFAYHALLNKYPKQPLVKISLSRFFKDESLVFAGCRTESMCAFSTLTGGGTGMGAMCRGNLQVVSFGPQHLPLGDCQGFGIESQQNYQSQSLIEISEINKSYRIEGIARLTPEPKTSSLRANFRNGDHSGCWIEAKQHFQNEELRINTTFHDLFDISKLAFVFFVKAQSCAVESIKIVSLRSFERYQGEVRKIILHGDQEILTIEAGQMDGGMQVIPLGGGDNFWGADFLIAYPLLSQKSNYSWVIK